MGIQVNHSIFIKRPLEEVFEYTVDANNLMIWQEGVVRVEGAGKMQVGMVYQEVRKVMGREMGSDVEVIAYDPPNSYTIQAKAGPVPFKFTQTCTGVEGGTQIDIHMEGEPGGFFGGIAGSMMQKQVQKDIEKDYAKLKEIMETG